MEGLGLLCVGKRGTVYNKRKRRSMYLNPSSTGDKWKLPFAPFVCEMEVRKVKDGELDG